MHRLEATTRLPRNQMIARISQAIQAAGGSMIDSRFFSNLALFISAEVESTRLAVLRGELIATELNFAAGSVASLDRHIEQLASTPDPQSVPFHLVVTFIHSETGLRIPVPAVPG